MDSHTEPQKTVASNGEDEGYAEANVSGVEKISHEDDKNKGNGEAVYGKTSTDKVPQTSDMTSVFKLDTRKSVFDIITIVVMGLQIILFFVLPSPVKRWIFLVLFIFWRASYNAGLGALLKYQSDKRGLVLWVKRKKIFDKEKGGKWYAFLKEELSAKMGNDYDFDTAPIEFNTWLLFRQLVDLILLNDFTTYVCFALANFNIPENSGLIVNFLRWVGGLFLLWFNVWVKADAHRVVKDFAWYWGDFFFLVDQSLTFDGVFEMAPHPMYSIGYVGYYGISLMMASYTVLFVSLSAHASQFVFLTFVENPHIDKTYNKPTPLNEKLSKPHSPRDHEKLAKSHSPKDQESTQRADSEFCLENENPHSSSDLSDAVNYYFRRDLIVFKNFDLLRSNDLLVVFMTFYAAIIPLFIAGASEGVIRIFLISQCLAWRIFHSYGLGGILFLQSKEKFLTKHYIKFGGNASEAFANWKSIYNLSLCMTYVTFVSAAWKMYYFPEDWTYGTVLLRHTLGVLLIALHIWTSVSIFEVLGDFGWFYGDFFLDDRPTTPYYTGIYRFLNNPEKLMGHTAFWGITLISNSWPIFGLTLFAQISNLLFLRYVEAPHMQKLYGNKIRKEDGVTKTIRRVILIPDKVLDEVIKIREVPKIQIVGRVVKEVAGTVEKVVEETAEVVGEFVGSARPKMRSLLENSRDKFMISRVSEVADNFDRKLYSISLIPSDASVGNTSGSDDRDANSKPIIFQFGEPISLSWTAPKNHSALDWIGIYKVNANTSKVITSVSSRGRFVYVTPEDEENETGTKAVACDGDDNDNLMDGGKVMFAGDRLPWEVGVYEFRYHHNDKHNVMATSQPFEIAVTPQYTSDLSTIEKTLLTLVQRVLDSDENLIPHTTSDYYKLMKEAHAKRIVYGIKMIFDVDFAWEVVAIDGNIGRLARRVERIIFCVFEDENKIVYQDLLPIYFPPSSEIEQEAGGIEDEQEVKKAKLKDSEEAESEKVEAGVSVSSTFTENSEDGKVQREEISASSMSTKGFENAETRQGETPTSSETIKHAEKEKCTAENNPENNEANQKTSTSSSVPSDDLENNELNQTTPMDGLEVISDANGVDSVTSSAPMDTEASTPVTCTGHSENSQNAEINQEVSTASNDYEERTETREKELDAETAVKSENLQEKETGQELTAEKESTPDDDVLMSQENEGNHLPHVPKDQEANDSLDIIAETEQSPSDPQKVDQTDGNEVPSSQNQEPVKGAAHSSL
ncbi:11682_t:CDS:2 [Acaulospora colombiana]|uniref:11682_t:CDS:1 n=1 Tax=Acaulospora colombiana TaxID=27376 RepID=A0ACA9K2P7_9GLOM|nr:11682_t:CDS:2 [Acaulospora colombiana]